ncbi:hypothetical protein ACIP5U_38010 [Streptomyces sp. NPDC088788]|uniref:hypothetical protein n=1 Tax=Streptomyces sp. NPDC088788 TaxID=3365898 RepID=UPI003807A382
MVLEFFSSEGDEHSSSEAGLDVVQVAGALLNSPHILTANAEPGDDTVYLTAKSGVDFTLSVQTLERVDDESKSLPEAIAAAILNSPHFVGATPISPLEDAIIVLTRDRRRHLLVIDNARPTAPLGCSRAK